MKISHDYIPLKLIRIQLLLRHLFLCFFSMGVIYAPTFAAETSHYEIMQERSADKDLYVWDNWLTDVVNVTSAGNQFSTIGRFALEAPRQLDGKAVTPVARHDYARVGFYIRTRPGQWLRLGQAIDIAPTWSGSSLVCNKCPEKLFQRPTSAIGTIDLSNLGMKLDFGGTLVLAYTERSFSPDPLGQRINIAFFDKDSGSFHRLNQSILDPWADPELASKLGYEISSNDVISAWRDPYLIEGQGGRLHLFFAARYNESHFERYFGSESLESFNPRRNSAIGHAIFDEQAGQWVLQPAEILSSNQAVQYELPQILSHKGIYYLLALKADWDVSSESAARLELNRDHSLIGFKSESLDGPWSPMGKADGELAKLKGVYGITFKKIADKVFMTGFLEDKVRLGQLVEVDINNFENSVRRGVRQLKGAELIGPGLCDR